MTRWFNVAGPCKADIHYMLPPAARLPDLLRLVQQQSYLVLYAPRQTGKTTAVWSFAKELTASGLYTSVVLSVEVGAAFNDDPIAAENAILGSWRSDVLARLPADLQPPPWPAAEGGSRLRTALAAWSQASTRPLVLFIDEIDALQDAALIAVLRQVRAGNPDRPASFPHSLALIGLRDVRDYKIASGGSTRLNTASPFNIKARSLTMGSFNVDELRMLYQQHVDETGQQITPEAMDYAFEQTYGQPWLVNALAKVAVEELTKDGKTPITPEVFAAAKEVLIQRQDTHLDSLAERLREPRVRAVIEPMLAGQELGEIPPDDLRFVQDLGLVRMEPGGTLVVANPIYSEVIPRVLSITTRASLPELTPGWLQPDGSLDLVYLRDAFLAFWQRHGEALLGTSPYPEIAPHLVLMAFLHRVVNGGGSIEREYAIGRDRMDLCVHYGATVLGIEIKVWRSRRGDPLSDGLVQLDGYLARLGLTSGWLVIFDQRRNAEPIEVRTRFEQITSPDGRDITLIRA
jgi:hypothetical protein